MSGRGARVWQRGRSTGSIWPRVRLTSVRTRITALAALVVGISLAIGAYGLLATLQHSLISNRDELSRARAVDLATQARSGPLRRFLVDLGEDYVGQVVAADGSVLAASTGLRGAGPISSTVGAAQEPSLRILEGVPDDTETESYRVWVLRTSTPSGPVTVFVGASIESVSEAVTTLRRSLLIGMPLMLVVLAGGTRVLVARALAPVDGLRSEVDAISVTELQRRVAVPPTRDEVARLAETMNAMLDRLEDAHRRSQEFVADASHELQSPLADFRLELEVALAHPEDIELPRLMSALLRDSERMERLVHDLLFLARGDATDDHGFGPTRLLDLDVVVLDEVARLRGRVPIELATSRVSAAPVYGVEADLARMVRNLLENAVDHASARVDLEVVERSSYVRLSVCDDGPGIPEDQRERVFQRFARVEAARERGLRTNGAGTGLGLSIARVIAERHGGTIVVGAPQEPGSRTCLLVTLPAAGPSASTAEAAEPHARA